MPPTVDMGLWAEPSGVGWLRAPAFVPLAREVVDRGTPSSTYSETL